MASSLQQGISAAKAGQMKKALDFLKDAIIEEPQNADVWVWVAAIIDDLEKQEIFLKKALEIDPNNIPAQRGLAYLQKRKRDEASVTNDHLSDYTHPISPFPASKRASNSEPASGWTKLEPDEMNKINHAVQHASRENNKPTDAFKDMPKLSPFEISLLGVVFIVFAFIGLLAASSLFEFELPLDWLMGYRPRLSTEPPYEGVFLYENDIYFDIQKHDGLPANDSGIPTSLTHEPVIVLWQQAADPEQMNLIYETGEYIPFQSYQARGKANLIQPESSLQTGLYCLQQVPESGVLEMALYWCFTISEPETGS